MIIEKTSMENDGQLRISRGHRPGLLDERIQQSDKRKASSPATAG